MKITTVRFVKSVFKPENLPRPSLPEIAFSGRSNVGKSSLINTLLNRKGIAKTSATPGRTQSINLIEVNASFNFVDLPGYGYARVPAPVRKNWQHLIEGYLANRLNLRLVILIIDARREPREDEALFSDWLKLHEIPLLVVLTKIDKLKKNMRLKSLHAWQKYLNTSDIIPFSAISGEGKQHVWHIILQHLQDNSSHKLLD